MSYLIVGASADVCMSYIKKLDAERQNVVVYGHCNNSYELLKELAESLDFVKLKLVRSDLSNANEVEAMISQIKKSGDDITHILHGAASKLEYVRFKDMDIDKLKYEMEIQVYSFVRILREFLPEMAKRRYGRVVAILSAVTLGKAPTFASNYVIVKHSLMGLIKSLASEYAKKGVTVNGVSPNMMETKFLDKIDSRTIEMNSRSTLMERNIKVSEVVEAIYYLMSDASSYITGVNMNLSGGDYM